MTLAEHENSSHRRPHARVAPPAVERRDHPAPPFAVREKLPPFSRLYVCNTSLFRRLDKTSDPGGYARQVSRLLPGHKFTILGYAGSSFEEIVRDMATATRTPPDVVGGISFGGFVAMRFAAQHPELVRRLVLLVSAHRFSPGGLRMMERQFETLERGDFRNLVRENALLFRRPWYNWLARFKLWKDGNQLSTDFRDSAAILARRPETSWEHQATRRDFAAVESRKPVPRSGPYGSRARKYLSQRAHVLERGGTPTIGKSSSWSPAAPGDRAARLVLYPARKRRRKCCPRGRPLPTCISCIWKPDLRLRPSRAQHDRTKDQASSIDRDSVAAASAASQNRRVATA